MIDRIQKKLSELNKFLRAGDEINQKSLAIQKKLKNNQQIIFDYNQLSQLFSDNEFIPFTNYSISPSTVLHVLNDILLHEKKNIIEFGAGSSTFFIAKFLKNLELNTKFYCVESDEKWIFKIRDLLERYELSQYVEIINSPLREVKKELSHKDQHLWHDTEILLDALGDNIIFDLILVDGPPGNTSSYSRFSAIPFLKPYLADEVSIYMDDTFRAVELEIFMEWQKILNLPFKHFNKYSLLTNNDAYDVEPFILNKW